VAAYGSGRYGYGPWSIGEASAALTGNASTLAIGSLLASRSIQEDGTVAIGNVGTVGITYSVAIAGNASTGSIGTILAAPIATGNSATGSVGAVIAEVISFQDITGVDGTGSVGTVASVISIEIIGNSATGAVGTVIGFGWGAIPDTSETWTPVSDTSETWVDISDNATTWQVAA